MTHSYLIAARRTPIGKLLGSLSSIAAPKLAGVAIKTAMADAGVPADSVDQVLLGNVLSAGIGQAPARQAALAAGIPPSVGAITINKVCGSGLAAVMLADQAIRAGDAKLVVAGGMENMSLAPHLMMGTRAGWKLGNQTVLDSMIHDGLWCACENKGMGVLADYTAAKHQISRGDQDAFSVESHARAIAAREGHMFDAEIVPIKVKGSKGEVVVDHDEGPRANSSLADLAKLRPSFGPEGTATAGNASQISDGAAAVLVASAPVAENVKSSIKTRVVASATHSGDAKELFTAPISAIEAVLAKAKLTVSDIDLFEINEAFAAQCLACARALRIEAGKLNINGGAIALGHPIGASGARVLVTLLHALAWRKLRYGVAALCLGGGEAVAMVVERVE
ncbi:MAG TPA: acetyl-CoA C-acyltransferase [Pirellulaceae bacterium]|jgi:acetyl-CoA C-acetyltransferase